MSDESTRALESLTIDEGWKKYAGHFIPAHVPADDFGREVAHHAYIGGATQVVCMLKRLRELPNADARRDPLIDQLFAELEATGLQLTPTVGSEN